MNDPIKVGDLVVMVRGCCVDCYCQALGVPFIVAEIFALPLQLHCHIFPDLGEHIVVQGFTNADIPITWLKRIPPLNETETEDEDEKLTA